VTNDVEGFFNNLQNGTGPFAPGQGSLQADANANAAAGDLPPGDVAIENGFQNDIVQPVENAWQNDVVTPFENLTGQAQNAASNTFTTLLLLAIGGALVYYALEH
jgi:hypothetical protein